MDNEAMKIALDFVVHFLEEHEITLTKECIKTEFSKNPAKTVEFDSKPLNEYFVELLDLSDELKHKPLREKVLKFILINKLLLDFNSFNGFRAMDMS